MAGITLHTVLDHLRRLHTRAEAAKCSDRELLHAFATDRDQDAFAVVVQRHAALVWGVCRRILGHQQDAEDAFQATFVILARRAGSVRWRPSVGGWLHTVAQRLAVCVRRQAEQRRAHEQQARRTPVDSSLRELAAVVDEELQRLPMKYREPLLLHYWEGMTAETVARQLGMSRALFYKRLNRGREMLRERLQRQGLSLAAPLLAPVLAPEVEAASGALIQATLRGVMGTVPERVAALAAEALGFTAVAKLKIGVALALLLGFAAGGVAMLTPQTEAPTPQAELSVKPPKAEDKSARRVDRYGDPLPPGAIARLGTLRFRTPGEIIALALAPDGKTLAVSSRGGFFLFDAASGKKIKRLPTISKESIRGDASVENPIVFSPDGKSLISRGNKVVGQSVRLVVGVWELAGERKPKEYDIGEWILWVGWTREGQPLALRGEDNGSLHLHDLSAGRSRRFACAKPYKYPSGVISPDPPFACSPRGRTLAVSDAENMIHVWDTTKGRERCTIQLKRDDLFSLTFSPDGSRLAIHTLKVLQMWDVALAKLLYSVDASMTYGSAVFAPDGKILALAESSSERILFWDAATGKERGHTQEKDDFALGFVFSPDSKWLVTSRRYGSTFHVWDVATGKRKAEPVGHRSSPYGAVFLPDGRRVATGGDLDGTIQFWNWATGEPLMRIHRPGHWLRNFALSGDGRSLISAWTDDQIWISDAASGERRDVIELEDPDRPDTRQSATSMYQSDDSKTLVVLSSYYPKKGGAGMAYPDTLITGWDTTTRKQLFRRRRPPMGLGTTLSLDARVLALAHPVDRRAPIPVPGMGLMRLEDVATGESLLTFPTLEGQTYPLRFSPDGRLLASNNHNSKRSGKGDDSRAIVYLWETATAAVVLSLPAADSPYNFRVAFSSDGRLLALTAPGQQILLYDLFDHRERQCFKGCDADVTWLTFSPDGRRLASGLSDSTHLVWDVGASAPPCKLGAEDAAKAWADLASTDAPRAFRARGALAAAPAESLARLTKHLHPAKAADPQRLRRLLVDLESEQFTVREKAQKELENLGDLAEPALRQALDNKPTLEMRRRAQALLEGLRGPVTRPELLRALRGVAVLEDIGTPEARRLLEQLAKGTPEARLTREAKASLRRLNSRKRDKS